MRSVVILVYERVAEVEEGTASVAFDVLNVFVGHVELCVIVQSNFVVWLAQVMQRLRNPRLMCQKIGVEKGRKRRTRRRWARRLLANLSPTTHQTSLPETKLKFYK